MVRVHSSEPMVRKKFDQKLYDKYDKEARLHFVKFLKHQIDGIRHVHDPYGTYGVDMLVIFPNGNQVLFDLEVRPVWKAYQEKFPFETIHLPSRKHKFTSYELPVYFIAFREDYKAFVVIDGNDLNAVIEVPNIYVEKGESFFDVDTNKCRIVYTK